MTLSRRSFLRASAATAGLAAARPWQAMEAMATPLGSGAPTLLDPASATFDHVVVVMMENRSYDHLLGWNPRGDGRQPGRVYRARDGKRYEAFNLAPDFQGCGEADPDHSWEGGLKQVNGGAMDGFLTTRPSGDPNDLFPIGYYTKEQIGIRGVLADSYTTFDRYFSSLLAETFPNRFYAYGARTDRVHNTGLTMVADPAGFPTIWDSLKAKGVEGRCYVSNLPFLGLWGTKYADIIKPYDTFLTDAAVGNLPALSWIEPDAIGEEVDGASNDDHPRGDIRGGGFFLAQIYNAVRNSPQWHNTVLVITYDECGGFADHVVPPMVAGAGTTIDKITVGDKPSDPGFSFNRLGIRVPTFLVSPFAPAQVWHEGPYDHTSILKMIEWRFGLPALTTRDAGARNLAEALDLTVRRPDTELPNPPLEMPFQAQQCSSSSIHYAQPAALPDAVVPEAPWAAALPLTAAAVGAGALLHRARTAPDDGPSA